jgi:hypothetical protein
MKRILVHLCFICIANLAFAQLDSALIAYWPLDGNANDISGNGYNGVFNGNMSVVQNRYGTDCAMSTSSSNSFISIPIEIIIDSIKGLSVSFWSKSKYVVDTNYTFSKNAYFQLNNLAIWFDSSTIEAVEDIVEGDLKSPSCSLFVTAPSSDGGTDNLPNCSSNWNHTVIVYKRIPNNYYGVDCYGVDTYRDNVLVNSYPCLPKSFHDKLKKVLLAKNSDSHIEDYDNKNNYLYFTDKMSFEYSLDDFRIYNRELTASDVSLLYNLQGNCFTTGLEEENLQPSGKTLLRILTLLGQVIEPEKVQEGKLYIYQYSDGSTRKEIKGGY